MIATYQCVNCGCKLAVPDKRGQPGWLVGHIWCPRCGSGYFNVFSGEVRGHGNPFYQQDPREQVTREESEFQEYLVQISRYEGNIHSPRFGQPIEYLITLNDARHI